MMLLALAPNANEMGSYEVVTVKNIRLVSASIFPLLISLLIFLYLQAFHCEAHDPLKETCTSVLECKACIKRYDVFTHYALEICLNLIFTTLLSSCLSN